MKALYEKKKIPHFQLLDLSILSNNGSSLSLWHVAIIVRAP